MPYQRQTTRLRRQNLKTHRKQVNDRQNDKFKFAKPWPTKSELRCAYYGRNKLQRDQE
jgi:hypothetical protein